MRKDSLALLALSLLIILAFTGCTFPGTATGLATSTPVAPPGPGVLPTGTSVSRAPSNTDGAETILIPGGTFWMGSDKSDVQADADEMPRHQVTLDPFYIYTHEVTSGMYVACVKAGACMPVTKLESGPTSRYGEPAFRDYPVTGVDWLMARDYCTWAKGRLPTEAEWELASRSTESLRFPWGAEEPTCDRVNMLGCSVPPDTLKVGSLANGNSAYDGWDMSGNVWEWVHDWYDKDFYFFSTAINPLGPNISEAKVVRSGGLYSKPDRMRSAARESADPNRPYDDVGFRCVPMAELSLPEGYVPVEEMHERVPSDPLEGGGEHVEEADPDPHDYFELRRITPRCPESGKMPFVFMISASAPLTLTASVDGVPFECEYDASTDVYQCVGPLPPGYGRAGRVTVVWSVGGEGISASGAWPVSLPLPRDCEPGRSTGVVVRGFTCPEAGYFEATVSYFPPTDWDVIRLITSTEEYDLTCVPVSDSEMTCRFPDVTGGGYATLYLHGTAPDGIVDEHFLRIRPVWDDCPAPMSIVGVLPVCYADHPAAQVMYEPPTLTLGRATADGTSLACIGTGPGVQMCGDLPGGVGASTTVTTCFEGEPACQDWPLTVPACPATSTELAFGMIPECIPTLGPVVTINYSPADQPLVSANADGSDLTCEAMPDPGLYMCHGITEAPGSELTITFCLADGSCHSGLINVRDCGGEEPSGAEFRIAGVGCHDETRIFFIVDTGLEWLVPGAGFTYSAWDEDHSYSCSVHPTIPGRLYCSGERPGAPARLRVCVHKDGAPSPVCQYFPEWPSREASIPDCAAPPPPGPTCSSHPDPASCTAAGCKWDKGPPDGNYHCYNP